MFRDMVSDLGPIELVHGFFAHRFALDMLKGWRTSATNAGDGIIDDSALHLIDLLVYLAGGRVQTVSARLLEGTAAPVPHSFACILGMDSGATVSACGSYLSPAHSVQEEISVLGTRGSLFARRFCRQWNTDPPTVFYKSADGAVARDYDLTEYPCGRGLPLVALLDVLQGRDRADVLRTEAVKVLETHRAIELIRGAARQPHVVPGAATASLNPSPSNEDS